MTAKKNRDRVMAEITLSHLLRLADEQGCPVSREQALVFLNQEGRAYEMWKQMMQAGEDFIKSSFPALHQNNGLPTSDLVADGRSQTRLPRKTHSKNTGKIIFRDQSRIGPAERGDTNVLWSALAEETASS